MNKNKQFDEILDRCLEQMRQGDTIEQCLALYPEQAPELRPLLETAATVKQVMAVAPRPELKAQLQQRLRAAAQEKPKKASLFFGWSGRWPTGVGVALALVVAGGGTVAAASSSMPDSTLYPVKQVTEQVRITLTFSDVGKAELYAKLADVRLQELDYLETRNPPQGSAQAVKTNVKIAQVRRQMNTALDKVVVLASVPPAAATGVMMAPSAAPPPTYGGLNATPPVTFGPATGVPTAPRPQLQTGKAAGTAVTTEQETKRAQLEERLAEYLTKRDDLEKALQQAPNARAKQAIEQAIKVSERGYGQTLQELQKINGNGK